MAEDSAPESPGQAGPEPGPESGPGKLPEPRRKPTMVDQRPWWPWVAGIVVPTALVFLGALLTVVLAPGQDDGGSTAANPTPVSGPSHGSGQQRAGKPPVLASVRPIDDDRWSWVFPTVLSDDQVKGLDAVLRDRYSTAASAEEHAKKLERADEAMRRAGGIRTGAYFPCDTTSVAPTCKQQSLHLVTITGNLPQRVQVVDVRVHVLARHAPPSATLLETPLGGQLDDVAGVHADLDGPDNRVYGITAQGRSQRPFFDTKTLSLEAGEPQGFHVYATTKTCWCEWELVVTVAHGGTEDQVIVRRDGSPDGPPFQTVADEGVRYGNVYYNGPSHRGWRKP